MKTKTDRIQSLCNASKVLKEEFVGLDETIDQLINSITPWYVTPEVMKRPVIISLWGMTGTGKTSVIRRLLTLLNLKERSLFYDCGQEIGNDRNGILRKLVDLVGDDVNATKEKTSEDLVFVFDEFQYARTLNELGEELDKPSLRPIWSLLDSGIVDISDSDYELKLLGEFFDDFNTFAESHPDIKVVNGEVLEKNNVKELLSWLGIFYDRQHINFVDNWNALCGEDVDQFRPIGVISYNKLSTIYRRLRSKMSLDEITKQISACKTIKEVNDLFNSYRLDLFSPKYLNCTKSIIFVLGNLDEAYTVSNQLSPDMKADVFADETAKVSITDIKDALKSRFRAEQIARFGNTIIKYPTLKEKHFRQIIKKETDIIINEFLNISGIKLNLTENFIDLLYSEGVYPVQGVRPLFTTINTMFTPLLSKIIIYNDHVKISNVIINVRNTSGFNTDKVDILLDYDNGETEVVNIALTLGPLRNPKNRRTRYINSVHEAGHAIVYSYLTGNLPINIMSVSADNGGFCTTYDSDKIKEIASRLDVKNEVMISLGGYCAEELIYRERKDMLLLGSSSDISSAWKSLSSAAYNSGYFIPIRFSNYLTENTGNIPGGLNSENINEKIEKEFNKLYKETKRILSDNERLLKKTALLLGEKGEIVDSDFKALIEEFGDTLTLNRLNIVKAENSSDWYEFMLKD